VIPPAQGWATYSMERVVDDLKQQAEELGIKVDGRWSDERLQSAIDKELGAPVIPKALTVRSLVPNPMRTLGLEGYGTVTLTARQTADERVMKRVDRAISLGILERA